MKRNIILIGILYGFLTTLVAMAVSYLANLLLGLPFFPFDLFEGISRILPARIIETFIQAIQSFILTFRLGPTDTTAKAIEQIQGLVLTLIAGSLSGWFVSWLASKHKAWLARGTMLISAVFILSMGSIEIALPPSPTGTFASILWLILLIAAWGFWLCTLAGSLPGRLAPAANPNVQTANPDEKITRRRFFILGVSALAGGVLLYYGLAKSAIKTASPSTLEVLSTKITIPKINFPFGPKYTSGPAASPTEAVLAKRLVPAKGVQDEVTPVDKLYRVDIDLEPTSIDVSTWRLAIVGLVQNSLQLSLADLVALPAQSQAVTIACISNLVGGSLIGTDYWTGVPLKQILTLAGPTTEAKGIIIRAADGFSDSFSLSEASDDRSLLVYAMNGQALTPEHGAPLRLYIPEHYGMKLPKWITSLELVNGVGSGYWEDRGWSKTAIPQTVSWFDIRSYNTAALNADGTFSLGGYAWAGSRVIKKVELQIDNSAWNEAELVDPPLSSLTWTSWRYDWKPVPGSHQVRVRATDGTGALQEAVNAQPFPEGAAGLDVINLQV